MGAGGREESKGNEETEISKSHLLTFLRDYLPPVIIHLTPVSSRGSRYQWKWGKEVAYRLYQ